MKGLLFISSIIYLTTSFTSCNSQLTPSADFGVTPMEVTPEGLNWYAIEDLEKMQNVKGKKVLVDMYTSWCGYCKMMDRKTFTDPQVVNSLNKKFVLVKFNAEQKEPIFFKGEEFKWLKGGKNGVNRLALKLMGARMVYPTMVYLDDTFEVITTVPGYKTPEELLEDLAIF